MSPPLDPQELDADALSQPWQGWLLYSFPPFPLLAVSAIFSSPDPPVCVDQKLVPPVPLRPAVSSRLHLGLEVVPSARMEARMQHSQATGFSEEVSRLAATPRRTTGSFASLLGVVE